MAVPGTSSARAPLGTGAVVGGGAGAGVGTGASFVGFFFVGAGVAAGPRGAGFVVFAGVGFAGFFFVVFFVGALLDFMVVLVGKGGRETSVTANASPQGAPSPADASPPPRRGARTAELRLRDARKRGALTALGVAQGASNGW